MKQTPNQLANKRKWRRAHPKARKEAYKRCAKRYYDKLLKTIYDHYGRVCACCGVTEEEFLTIGHVGGWGAVHRKSLGCGRGGGTMRLWRDIIRRGFPEDIRIECANCNFGAARNGGVCPHVKLRQAPISTA